ncbi:hypothetical protein [Dyella sp. OK004]|uniref:hypothetical protein n=1 Tax=Dyella sp. OK004 TaxID=1855292 RepID=UPI0011605C4A|nr:hypothetical protein [Dyella sp. OK004]
MVITLLSVKLLSLVNSELVAHLVFSMFAASGMAYLWVHAGLHGKYRWPVLAIMLNPCFGVWASVIGRESLFVGLLGYFMGAVLAYYTCKHLRHLLLAGVCLAGLIFVRSAYGIGLAIFLIMFVMYTLPIRMNLSAGVHIVLAVGLAALLVIVAWPALDNYLVNDILPKAKSYFTLTSATTRTWIQLRTSGDLFSGLWWSLPLALVGPTPGEVAARPVMLPFFVSGLVIVGVLLHQLWLTLNGAMPKSVRKVLMLAWLPSLVVILISYVPFGIYNPGSGIRYLCGVLPFLVFPALFCSTVRADSRCAPLRVMYPAHRSSRVLGAGP